MSGELQNPVPPVRLLEISVPANGKNWSNYDEEKVSPNLPHHLFRLFPHVHILGDGISVRVADYQSSKRVTP